jgi:hypothetical protein
MPVIGYLSARSPEDTAHLVEAFRRGLGETGFFEGQDTCVVDSSGYWTKALIQSASYPRSASSIDPDLRRDKSAAASLLSCASPGVSASRTGRKAHGRMRAAAEKRCLVLARRSRSSNC